jgi:phosphate transport system protein
MPREQYQDELDGLRAAVVDFGDRALAQLDDGLAALSTGDRRRARAAVQADRHVNERYLELESRCIDLLALQQPVASDLRFVTASFKILTDIERVADLAVNLGEYAAAAADGDGLGPEVALDDIGAAVRSLLVRALEAYETGDPEACRAVAADDDEVDALCAAASETVARELVEQEAAADAWELERLLDDVSRLLLTVRDLERVGDHAVNIAARTLYMTESDAELLY